MDFRFYLLFCCLALVETKRTPSSSNIVKQDFLANVVYNKLSEHPLNLNDSELISIEPRSKVWFTIDKGIIYALPLFGDYSGPFQIQFRAHDLIEMKLRFDIAPSPSLFSPSNHLLLALFNLSSITYRNSSFNRFLIVRTLSLALNLPESLLTIHRINGSMIKVYFSCDFYSTNNLAEQILSRIEYYYTQRLQLISLLPLPLLDISLIRLSTGKLRLKTTEITNRPRLNVNRTFSKPPTNMSNPLFYLHQYYQPLVILPLAIIVVGLLLCSLIAFCLCCHRRSSSTSTLLLPSGPLGNPNNKHLYENYSYRKHRQQQKLYKKKRQSKDQRQFISKGIPVIFAEELEEKIEQAHTPLVMRIERTAPLHHE